MIAMKDLVNKIISMYAKGMTTQQISETIEDIYGFEVSEGMVSLLNQSHFTGIQISVTNFSGSFVIP